MQALGLPQPLLITHRLDQCTEGLLVLGRTKSFVARFNELVKRSSNQSSGGGGSSDSAGNSARRRSGGSSSGGEAEEEAQTEGGLGGGTAAAQRPLRKFYRAVTASPPPLGLLRHHLSIERQQQGLPQFTIAHEAPVGGSLPAELRVLQVQPVRWAVGWVGERSGMVDGEAGCAACRLCVLTQQACGSALLPSSTSTRPALHPTPSGLA